MHSPCLKIKGIFLPVLEPITIFKQFWTPHACLQLIWSYRTRRCVACIQLFVFEGRTFFWSDSTRWLWTTCSSLRLMKKESQDWKRPAPCIATRDLGCFRLSNSQNLEPKMHLVEFRTWSPREKRLGKSISSTKPQAMDQRVDWDVWIRWGKPEQEFGQRSWESEGGDLTDFGPPPLCRRYRGSRVTNTIQYFLESPDFFRGEMYRYTVFREGPLCLHISRRRTSSEHAPFQRLHRDAWSVRANVQSKTGTHTRFEPLI